MTFNNMNNKTAIAAIIWTLAIGVAGLGAGVESGMGWLMVTVLALGPSLTVLHFWKDSPQTTSEAIQEARR
jgi:hypothetical protein